MVAQVPQDLALLLKSRSRIAARPASSAARRAARGTTGGTCAGSARRAPRPGARPRDRRPSRARRGSPRASARPARSSSSWANSHGLPSDPRASITAAAPVCSSTQRMWSGASRPPETITGTGQRRDELLREVVVGHALVAHGGRARVEARCRPRRPPRRAGARRRRPRVSPGLRPARSLTVTGRPEPSRAASATATAVSGSPSIAAPAPVLQTFGTGQPMLRSMRSAPARATVAAAERMISGSWPKSWTETGPPARSSGWMTQQLVERLAVAVVDGEARDHLRHREPGAVALGLQAHEPVADAGQRRQHDAVRDGQAAEDPGLAQRAHAPSLGAVALPDQLQARSA